MSRYSSQTSAINILKIIIKTKNIYLDMSLEPTSSCNNTNFNKFWLFRILGKFLSQILVISSFFASPWAFQSSMFIEEK